MSARGNVFICFRNACKPHVARQVILEALKDNRYRNILWITTSFQMPNDSAKQCILDDKELVDAIVTHLSKYGASLKLGIARSPDYYEALAEFKAFENMLNELLAQWEQAQKQKLRRVDFLEANSNSSSRCWHAKVFIARESLQRVRGRVAVIGSSNLTIPSFWEQSEKWNHDCNVVAYVRHPGGHTSPLPFRNILETLANERSFDPDEGGPGGADVLPARVNEELLVGALDQLWDQILEATQVKGQSAAPAARVLDEIIGGRVSGITADLLRQPSFVAALKRLVNPKARYPYVAKLLNKLRQFGPFSPPITAERL